MPLAGFPTEREVSLEAAGRLTCRAGGSCLLLLKCHLDQSPISLRASWLSFKCRTRGTCSATFVHKPFQRCREEMKTVLPAPSPSLSLPSPTPSVPRSFSKRPSPAHPVQHRYRCLFSHFPRMVAVHPPIDHYHLLSCFTSPVLSTPFPLSFVGKLSHYFLFYPSCIFCIDEQINIFYLIFHLSYKIVYYRYSCILLFYV